MASRNLAAGLVGALALTGATALAPPPATSTSISAAPQVRRVDRGYADGALGNGLGRLLKQAKNPGSARSHGLKIDQAALAIRDPQGRVLVDLTPAGGREPGRVPAAGPGGRDVGPGGGPQARDPRGVRAAVRRTRVGRPRRHRHHRPGRPAGHGHRPGHLAGRRPRARRHRAGRRRRRARHHHRRPVRLLRHGHQHPPRHPAEDPREERREDRRPAGHGQRCVPDARGRGPGRPDRRQRVRRGPRHAADRARRGTGRQAVLRHRIRRHARLRRQHPQARRQVRPLRCRRDRGRREVLRRAVLLRLPALGRDRRRGRRRRPLLHLAGQLRTAAGLGVGGPAGAGVGGPAWHQPRLQHRRPRVVRRRAAGHGPGPRGRRRTEPDHRRPAASWTSSGTTRWT